MHLCLQSAAQDLSRPQDNNHLRECNALVRPHNMNMCADCNNKNQVSNGHYENVNRDAKFNSMP